jgi:DnaK suppressor protein
MDDKQMETYRQRLLALRTEIEHDSETTADARKPVELDQTMVGRLSRMDALQEQAMQVETERRRHQELQRIEAALERIDEGEFGYCAVCGDEIELKRLEHDPTVPTCIACAKG